MESNETIFAVLRIFADGERYAARGTLKQQGTVCTLSYRDPGMDNTPTTLRFDEASLTIVRNGAYQTALRFRRGTEEQTEYQTPYGALTLTVRTEQLQISTLPSGWQLELSYVIGFADGSQENHEMSILITI